jgi:hypothetical protein
MSTETEDEDEAGERVHAAVDRIYAGDLAIAAVARGEPVDPEVLDRAADGLAELLAPGVTGATWTPEDVERVRRLRGLLTGDAPSPAARALAAAHVPIFSMKRATRSGRPGAPNGLKARGKRREADAGFGTKPHRK